MIVATIPSVQRLALLILCLGMFACGQDEMGVYDASGQGSEEVFSSSPSSDFEAPVVVLLEDELCFESLEFMAEEQNQIHFQFSCICQNKINLHLKIHQCLFVCSIINYNIKSG